MIRLPGYQKCPTCGSNLHVLSSKPINPDDPEALATMCFEAVDAAKMRQDILSILGRSEDWVNFVYPEMWETLGL